MGPTPTSFCLFVFFKTTILQKIEDYSGIRTRIVRVEGEPADHLTTPTPQFSRFFLRGVGQIIWTRYAFVSRTASIGDE